MRLLQLGADGAGADEMVKYAGHYWDRGNAGGHFKNVEAGQEQAKAAEQHFRELAKTWFAH
jgi:hypothetical protein